MESLYHHVEIAHQRIGRNRFEILKGKDAYAKAKEHYNDEGSGSSKWSQEMMSTFRTVWRINLAL